MKLGSMKGGDKTAEETPFRSNENDDSDEDADADDVKIVKADPRLFGGWLVGYGDILSYNIMYTKNK